MRIKSETDLYVSTTWGSSITLKAGEEREVGDDMGYQALQRGAVEVRDKPSPTPAPKKRSKKSKSSVKVEVTK